MRALTRRALGPWLAALLCLTLLAAGPAGAAWPNRAAVPDVKGKQVKVAIRLLTQAGFDNVNVIGLDTDKRGLHGVVQSQAPPAGVEVSTNATIKLSVYEYSP